MNGILLVDKPEGWTSHDVVAKLRGILGVRRIGHSGTLDPMATGLLVVFVGRATRAVEFAESDRKRYTAELRLGLTTDTLDTTGNVLEEKSCFFSLAELEAVLPEFRGEISQLPPMYSAIKIGGKKLYELARKGQEVERRPRAVTIYELEAAGQGSLFTLEILCSKGTYIRSLCGDIGRRLGCGGCMSALRRSQAGAFHVSDAPKLEEISRETPLIPVDRLFAGVPAVTIGAAAEKRCRNGNELSADAPDGECRLYSEAGEFLALGTASNGKVKLIKSFFEV